MKPHYRAVFLSDTHLGTHACRAEQLANFLNSFTAGEIYLVGDIIDLKALRLRTYWDEDTSRVFTAFLEHLETTPIYYVLGNHDEALQPFVGAAVHPNLSIVNEAVHQCFNKNRLLVIHGHQLPDTSISPLVEKVGGRAYDVLVGLSNALDRGARHVLLSPPKLMHRLKMKLPGAQKYIDMMHHQAKRVAAGSGFDGTVYGHTHVPYIGGEYYLGTRTTMYNLGDWVENRTALVEHTNGQFELLRGLG
jgi:UDP-2,3-diacylglucosamine pyrophosphatase LpxH